MATNEKRNRYGLLLGFSLALNLPFFSGCGEHGAAAPKGNQLQGNGAQDENSAKQSADYRLDAKDIEKFRAGRLKRDILEDVGWRGNFYGSDPNGCVISYKLFFEGPNDDGSEVVLAVFVDDRFVKFVRWWPVGSIQVQFPIEISDMRRWVARAVESEAVDIAALEREVRARPPIPSQVDPGLTAAFLLLRAAGKISGPDNEENLTPNAELRGQFNAARLELGMTEAEVEAIFKAKPLMSFPVEAGTVTIFGSDEEAADATIETAYTNVLILFDEGKASAIYAIRGGPDWRAEARKLFRDFPSK